MATSEILDPEQPSDASTTWRVVSTRRSRRSIASMAPGADLGTTLRKLRRRRRVSLEQAALQTRIPVRYLQALEANAPPEAFPAPAYARAFLREYARFLGLELKGLTELLGPNTPEPIAPTLAVLAPPASRGAWLRQAMAVLAGAVLIAALLVGTEDPRPTRKLSDPVETLPSERAEPIAPAAVGPADETAPRASEPVSELTAEVRTTGRSWIGVIADGRTVREGILEAGEVLSFQAARSLRIRVGDAAALVITVNGRPVGPLGTRGEVREVVVTLQDGHLSIRTLAG